MQTKRQSLIEVTISTAVAFVLSVLAGQVLYPVYGHRFTLLDNIQLTLWYTVISIVRSYVMRRIFNRLHR